MPTVAYIILLLAVALHADCPFKIYEESTLQGDYYNELYDQSVKYGLADDKCCTRVRLDSSTNPATICNSMPNCQGFVINRYFKWATFKNSTVREDQPGSTSFALTCEKNPSTYYLFLNTLLGTFNTGNYYNASIDESSWLGYDVGTCTRLGMASYPFAKCTEDPKCTGVSMNTNRFMATLKDSTYHTYYEEYYSMQKSSMLWNVPTKTTSTGVPITDAPTPASTQDPTSPSIRVVVNSAYLYGYLIAVVATILTVAVL